MLTARSMTLFVLTAALTACDGTAFPGGDAAGASPPQSAAGNAEPSRAAPSYRELIPVFWQEVYSGDGVTLYCGFAFGDGRERRFNIEHVMPMSWVGNALNCGDRSTCRRLSPQFNRVESDFHNLYPVLADVNELRGSMAFAELRGERHVREDCDLEIDRQRRLVEPRPAARGPIARAMLYMAETYGVELYPRQRALMERWNRDYPPDPAERERHRRIAALQGTQNRFISEWETSR